MGDELGETMDTTRSATTILPKPMFSSFFSIPLPFPIHAAAERIATIGDQATHSAGTMLFHVLDLLTQFLEL
jgi:hypothetical protein